MSSGSQGGDRLDVELEAVGFQGLGQARDRRHLALALQQLAIVGAVHLHAVAPALLGRVARRVSRLERLLRVAAAGAERHQSHAGADLERLALPVEAQALQLGAQLLGHPLAVGRCAVGEDHPELVSSQARDRVIGTQAVDEHPGDAQQELVARGMPAGVVDDLQMVEIEVAQHVPEAGLRRRSHGVAQASLELAPVGQRGQRIGAGLLGELRGHGP